jgi:membrane protein implicated in regulation of membrane protease activity
MGRCYAERRNRFRARRTGQSIDMTIGTSIFLIGLGAILAFAVNATVAGISIQTAGVILIAVGVLGLVIGLFMLSRHPRETERTVYEDRPLYR